MRESLHELDPGPPPDSRRGRTTVVSACAALLLLGLFTTNARAGDDLDAAREHYQKGKRAYDVGHFAEAAKEYELAYAAKDDPALLFNLGQAHRLANNRTAAVLAYKAYLRNAPDAPNRAEVEQRIEELQAAPSVPSTTGPPLTPAVPSLQAAPDVRARPRRLWPVVVATTTAVVVVVAGVALGLGFGLHASDPSPSGGTFVLR